MVPRSIEELERKGLFWRETLDSSKLMAEYPPKFMNPHKNWIYSQISTKNFPPKGALTLSRWQALPIPSKQDFIPPISGETKIEVDSGFFRYQTKPNEFMDDQCCVWHLNFADRNLFGYYQGALFAQDEMQVMEHPILGSVRSWLEEKSLENSNYHPNTQDASGSPTPYLFRGVERRVKIATGKNSQEGRPYGLYGNHFMRASKEAIEKAMTVLNPPTISNILAISAISPRYGFYTREQIVKLFTTVYTGFVAARVESQRTGEVIEDVKNKVEEVEKESEKGIRTIIHTGNWGCGVFGGNPTLIALIQLLGAYFAGIDILVYHPVSNMSQFKGALDIFNRELKLELKEKGAMDALIKLENYGYKWGVSDGN